MRGPDLDYLFVAQEIDIWNVGINWALKKRSSSAEAPGGVAGTRGRGDVRVRVGTDPRDADGSSRFLLPACLSSY